jgi:hypothetical protein
MSSVLRNEAGTPWEVFETLHREYRFTIDICATAENAKLPRYLTIEDDALTTDWSGERVWCNPPYRDIPPWLFHATEPELVAYLLPVRSDRRWWRAVKPRFECHYFEGEKPHRRMEFIPPPGIVYSSNPMCMCLLLFGEGTTPGLECFRSGLTGERL